MPAAPTRREAHGNGLAHDAHGNAPHSLQRTRPAGSCRVASPGGRREESRPVYFSPYLYFNHTPPLSQPQTSYPLLKERAQILLRTEPSRQTREAPAPQGGMHVPNGPARGVLRIRPPAWCESETLPSRACAAPLLPVAPTRQTLAVQRRIPDRSVPSSVPPKRPAPPGSGRIRWPTSVSRLLTNPSLPCHPLGPMSPRHISTAFAVWIVYYIEESVGIGQGLRNRKRMT